MENNILKKNLIFSLANQVAVTAIPLIMIPYISRILSPELIGDYSYALANSNYFVLLECLGLNLYGLIAISPNRDNAKTVEKLFYSIMFNKLVLMAFSTFLYFMLFVVSTSNKLLNSMMILNLIANGIDTSWYMSGFEEFKITALINIISKTIACIFVFILVKSKNDFFYYVLIMQGSILLSSILLIPIVLKRVTIVRTSMMEKVSVFKDSIKYFVPGLVTTIFSSADKTVLGVFSNSYEVGIYEQAHKISSFVEALINSLSNVLLPHYSYLFHKGNVEEIKLKVQKVIKLVSIVSFPIAIGTICIAKEFVPFFLGKEYMGCITILQILSINIIVNVYSNYLSQQCLISCGRQKAYNWSIIIGSAINVLLNLFFVSKYKSIGVSIASILANFIVFAVIIRSSKSIITLGQIFNLSWKPLVASAIMMLFVYPISNDFLNNFSVIAVKVVLGIILYFALLIILNESLIAKLFKKVMKPRNS